MTNDEQRKIFEESINAFKANEEHYEMAMKNMSKVYWIRYTALIEEGFTKEQAFEIVKFRGIT